MTFSQKIENIAEGLLCGTISEGLILTKYDYRKNKNFEDIRNAVLRSRSSKSKYNCEDIKSILIFQLKNILKKK